MDETTPTPRGNPYKFNRKRRAAYLDLLRDPDLNLSRSAAAEEVGLFRGTVLDAIKHDPEFAAAVERAEDERLANQTHAVKNALVMAATSGNVEAIKLWLFNRDPDNWRDVRSVKHEVDLMAPIRAEAIRLGYDPDRAVELATEVMKLRQANAPLQLRSHS